MSATPTDDGSGEATHATRWLSIALLAGVGIYVLGAFWDARWHDRNPGALESGTDLLEAHGGYWLALAIVIAAASWGVVGDGRSRRSWSYVVALCGGVLAAVGMAWDAYAHAGGNDSDVAHSVSALGTLIAISGIAVRAWSIGSHRPG